MRLSILRPLVVVLLGLVVLAFPPGSSQAAAPTANNCNEWISCTGGCCETDLICDLLCPSWVAAVCTEDEIFCVDEPT